MDATLSLDAVQTSPFAQVDRRFFAVLFGSILLHAVAATWVARQPHVASYEEPAAEARAFNRVTLPPLLPIPKTFPPVKARPPGGPKKPPQGNPNGGPGAPGLGALLATAIDDLKGKDDVEAALSGAKQGHVDTTTIAVRRERGPNEAQTIAPITTAGGGSVGFGEHVDAPALKPVIDEVIIDGPGVPDLESFMRFINARRPAFAACYERELKYNRSLRGRVTVHLTVASDGRAREVEVDQDSLGSRAVADCIETLVKRWTFPVKPSGEQPLQFPVLFSPAQ